MDVGATGVGRPDSLRTVTTACPVLRYPDVSEPRPTPKAFRGMSELDVLPFIFKGNEAGWRDSSQPVDSRISYPQFSHYVGA